MKSIENLPEGYKKIYSINLQKNKKTAIVVNLLSFIIAILLVVPAHFYVPIYYLFSMKNGLKEYLLRFIVLLALTVLYFILHELVHGIAMKICGTKNVKYGFTGLYAFTASKDYYDKKSYIFIALAPVVLWGIVLAVIIPFVPMKWFWVVYMIQIFNISGAAGDLYVTVKCLRLPSDILIQDSGADMTVYSKK